MVPLAPVGRLEKLEIDVSAACVPRDAAAAVLDVAGGKAMFIGPDSPMNSVKGVGMAGPVSARELDAISAFFRERGQTAPVTFDACPFADDSLVALISERAWPFAGFEQVLWRGIDSAKPDAAPAPIAGLTITAIDSSRAEEWALVLARVFSGLDDPPRWHIDIGVRGFAAPGGTAWAALHGGRIVAAARSLVFDGAAHLSGAAVLPEFRNRGLQTAMLLARLRQAAELGCDLAKIDTKAGTTSQRNAQRLGFEVAYTRGQFMMPV